MAYTATWVNRVDNAASVDIDLNLQDGAVFHRRSYNFNATPATVDAAYLAGEAAAAITTQTDADTAAASRAALLAACDGMLLFQTDDAAIDTLISEQSLPWTADEVRAFIAGYLSSACTAAMQNLADRRYP
jgi:hypothetical protein